MKGQYDLSVPQEFHLMENDMFTKEELGIYAYLESQGVRPVNVQDYVRESLSCTAVNKSLSIPNKMKSSNL